jgi:hypothetical protein
MADIAHSLMIKYGLLKPPSDDKIKLWIEKTEHYISTGIKAEEAGAKAAQEIFPDYGKVMYASQADTIAALLNQARNK